MTLIAGTMFGYELGIPPTLSNDQYVPTLTRVLGGNDTLAAEIAAEYPVDEQHDHSSAWWTLDKVLRDSVMLCPAKQAAAGLNSRAGNSSPVFVYFYTRTLLLVDLIDILKPLGCFHSSELASVFDFEPVLAGPGEREMARTFVNYWANFATYGDPNQQQAPSIDGESGRVKLNSTMLRGTDTSLSASMLASTALPSPSASLQSMLAASLREGFDVPVWLPWGARNRSSSGGMVPRGGTDGDAGIDNIAQIDISIDGSGLGEVNVTNTRHLEDDKCTFWSSHPIPYDVIWGRPQ